MNPLALQGDSCDPILETLDSFSMNQSQVCFPCSIRSANPEDLDALCQLMELSIRTLNAQDYTESQIEAIISHNSSKKHFKNAYTYLAEEKDKILGFVSYKRYLWMFGIINAMFVHPDFARQGIGRQLLAFAEKEATMMSTRVFYVVSSLTAIKFYAACGYGIMEKEIELKHSGQKVKCALFHKGLYTSPFIENLIVNLILLFFSGLFLAILIKLIQRIFQIVAG